MVPPGASWTLPRVWDPHRSSYLPAGTGPSWKLPSSWISIRQIFLSILPSAWILGSVESRRIWSAPPLRGFATPLIRPLSLAPRRGLKSRGIRSRASKSKLWVVKWNPWGLWRRSRRVSRGSWSRVREEGGWEGMGISPLVSRQLRPSVDLRKPKEVKGRWAGRRSSSLPPLGSRSRRDPWNGSSIRCLIQTRGGRE